MGNNNIATNSTSFWVTVQIFEKLQTDLAKKYKAQLQQQLQEHYERWYDTQSQTKYKEIEMAFEEKIKTTKLEAQSYHEAMANDVLMAKSHSAIKTLNETIIRTQDVNNTLAARIKWETYNKKILSGYTDTETSWNGI